MKKILRRLSLVMIVAVLVFTCCKENQNTIAGHEYVDLGLPSGLKWATCNVGATTPEEYGNYYAWGETKPKTEYTEENSATFGVELLDINSNPTYDVARANWGSTWRMPTMTEMDELIDNCTCKWTTENGVSGSIVTGPNGNSIFLPAAGYCDTSSYYDVGEYGDYWSSTPYERGECVAMGFSFNSIRSTAWYSHRFLGLPIRPVSD